MLYESFLAAMQILRCSILPGMDTLRIPAASFAQEIAERAMMDLLCRKL